MNKKNVGLFIIIICILIHDSKSVKCSEDTCPHKQGECIENICLCAPGYITYYPKNTLVKEKLCNYPIKYKYYAIWLEMLFPFGLGHFYSCRYLHGFIKFLLFWFLTFLKSVFKKKIRGYPELVKSSIILLWVFGFFYCLDFFGYTFDLFLDGNKIPLR